MHSDIHMLKANLGVFFTVVFAKKKNQEGSCGSRLKVFLNKGQKFTGRDALHPHPMVFRG